LDDYLGLRLSYRRRRCGAIAGYTFQPACVGFPSAPTEIPLRFLDVSAWFHLVVSVACSAAFLLLAAVLALTSFDAFAPTASSALAFASAPAVASGFLTVMSLLSDSRAAPLSMLGLLAQVRPRCAFRLTLLTRGPLLPIGLLGSSQSWSVIRGVRTPSASLARGFRSLQSRLSRLSLAVDRPSQ